jgi:hypothetical protein
LTLRLAAVFKKPTAEAKKPYAFLDRFKKPAVQAPAAPLAELTLPLPPAPIDTDIMTAVDKAAASVEEAMVSAVEP